MKKDTTNATLYRTNNVSERIRCGADKTAADWLAMTANAVEVVLDEGISLLRSQIHVDKVLQHYAERLEAKAAGYPVQF